MERMGFSTGKFRNESSIEQRWLVKEISNVVKEIPNILVLADNTLHLNDKEMDYFDVAQVIKSL